MNPTATGNQTRSTANTGPRSAVRFVINFVLNFLFSSYLGYLEHFLQLKYLSHCSSVDRAMDLLSGGSGFKSHIWPYFFNLLNEELNQMENNNKNASNSLVFGRWPQTKTGIALRVQRNLWHGYGQPFLH